MPDQADQLRQLVRQTVEARPPLGPGLPIVVLSGGVQGVGTTTLSIQLARELAHLGNRAVLVDANLTRPDIAARLGVEPHGCLAEVLTGDRSAKEVLQPVGEGVSLLASRQVNDTQPHLNRSAVIRLFTELRTLQSAANVVIVDAGSGMTPWVQRWWRAAKQVFLITTEHEQAVKNSYATAKLAPWGDADGKLRLVVNRCDQRESAEQLTARFASTCRRFLGLHVSQAPAIACGQVSRVAFRHSMCLLAAEIVSSCLVVSGRLSNHQHTEQQPTRKMLATPEKTAHSTKSP